MERLRVHLRPLQREGAIDYWDDGRIEYGGRWADDIEAALKKARIAILLVSGYFLASEFVVRNELPGLLAAAEERGTTILPVIIKPCRFLRDSRLSVFRAVNDPRTPLMSLSEVAQERIYDQVAERIENELKGVS